MSDYDPVSKADVLETYADLYDVFENNKAICKELDKVYDRLNTLPSAQEKTHDKRTETLACDCISRQAAIDALDGEIEITGRTNAEAVKGYVRLIKDRLERLPPAQLDTCDGCKHHKPFGDDLCASCRRGYGDNYEG